MRDFFSKTAEDKNIWLELEAYTQNGDPVEKISAEIHSMDLLNGEGRFVDMHLYAHKNVAASCARFYKSNAEEKNHVVEARLFLDNTQTYYCFRPAGAVRHIGQVKKDGKELLRIEGDANWFSFYYNGKKHGGLIPPEDDVSCQELSDRELEEIVDHCMAWQAQNPPRRLSPMEQMRMKAGGMFSAGVQNAAQLAVNQTATASDSKIFNPDSLKITTGSKNYKKDIESIVGLDEVKEEFERMALTYLYQKDRAERLGTNVAANSMHMCFLGPPGTGKTTIARLVAGFLYENGIIKRNECIEISGLDLIANFTGQTSEKTRIILNRAKGGVLFIDEAYAIADDGFGKEAISVLLKEIEDNRGDLVVIFAGYEADMQRFLEMNEGFKSRINRYFHFQNYKPDALANIFVRILRERALVIEKAALLAVIKKFSQVCNGDTFSNGRYVRNMAEKIEGQHIFNVRKETDMSKLNVVTEHDVTEVCK